MALEGEVLAGKYRLDRFLGSGGFASVWEARNLLIDRRVALKILADTFTHKPQVVRRFIREAKLASRPLHPVIVRVEDIGQTDDGAPFLVMELLDGHTLEEEIRVRGSLPVGEAIAIAAAVLQGLEAAHDEDIVHRDVKPANIFLMHKGAPDPTVRILDLGVAKDLTDEETLTGSGQVVGTAAYLAPEVLTDDARKHWGPTVDIFALGMVLFYMLTGRFPIEERTKKPMHLRIAERVLRYRSGEPLRSIRDLDPNLSKSVDRIVRQALEIEPTERFQSADEFLEELEEAAALLPLNQVFDDRIAATIRPSAGLHDVESKLREIHRIAPQELAVIETAALVDAFTSPDGGKATPVLAQRTPSPSEDDPPEVEDDTPAHDDEAESPSQKRGSFGLSAFGLVVTLAVAIGLGALLVSDIRSRAHDNQWGERDSGTNGATGQAASRSEPARDARTHDAPATTLAEGTTELENARVVESAPRARMELRGLPREARVSFAERSLDGDVVEGEIGQRGTLDVRAPGYRRFRQEITLGDTDTFDLTGRLRGVDRGSEKSRSGSKRRHIEGRRRGSKIKVLSD